MNRPEWQASLKRVSVLDPGPPHPGQRWTDHVAVGPAFEPEIIAMDEGVLWARSGLDRPLHRLGTLCSRGRHGRRHGRDEGDLRGPGARPHVGLAGHRGGHPCLVRNDLRRTARILAGR